MMRKSLSKIPLVSPISDIPLSLPHPPRYGLGLCVGVGVVGRVGGWALTFENFGQVLVQSHKMNLASAVRMAQDFHIIPVYISRQQVANRI